MENGRGNFIDRVPKGTLEHQIPELDTNSLTSDFLDRFPNLEEEKFIEKRRIEFRSELLDLLDQELTDVSLNNFIQSTGDFRWRFDDELTAECSKFEQVKKLKLLKLYYALIETKIASTGFYGEGIVEGWFFDGVITANDSYFIKMAAIPIYDGYVDDIDSIEVSVLQKRELLKEFPGGYFGEPWKEVYLEDEILINGVDILDTYSDELIDEIWNNSTNTSDNPELRFHRVVLEKTRLQRRSKYRTDQIFPTIKKADSDYFAVTAINLTGLYNEAGILLGVVDSETGGLVKLGESKVLEIYKDNQDFAHNLGIFEMVLDLKYREQIEEDLGINLVQFTLREQFAVFQYLTSIQSRDPAKLRVFLNRFGNDGFRTFLATENDLFLSQLLLTLGDQTDARVMEIFHSYGRLALTAQTEGERIAQLINSPSLNADAVTNHLLNKAKRVLSKGITNLATKGANGSGTVDLQSLTDELFLKSNMMEIYFTYNPEGKLEDIPTSPVERVAGPNLIDTDIDRIRELYLLNWPNLSNKMTEQLMAKLAENIANPDTDFYFLKQGGEIQVFVFVESIETGHYYLGGFNSDPSLHGFGIGGAFFKALTEGPLGNKTLELISKQDSPVTDYYINQLGWYPIGTELPPDERASESALRLRRDSLVQLRQAA